jgi:hypothetical protein
MSQSKFAPVTANLLVRKGEAAPSPVAPSARPVAWLADTARPPGPEALESKFVFHQEEPHENSAHCADGRDICGANEKPRRIVLNLTPHEYETLGLVAVKKNSTRHQLAQEAMDAYFEWLISEYGEACDCIVGGALCRCECGRPTGASYLPKEP